MRPYCSYDAETGAAYVRVTGCAHAETRELVPGKVFADFDANGNLIGVEVLGTPFVRSKRIPKTPAPA